MSIVVVGLDHRTTPKELFDKALVSPDRLPDVLDKTLKSDDIAEAVVVSTCLRTEIYVDALRFHGAVAHLREIFAGLTGESSEGIWPHLIDRHDDNACSHLFATASGLNSAVVGEGEVLGQIGRAWQKAQQHGACRSVLNGVFRRALVAGKRVRTETSIGKGVVSVSKIAVATADDLAGGLAGKAMLVIGAGDVATVVAETARRFDIGHLVVANRSQERGRALGARVGAQVIELTRVAATLRDVDVVVAATAGVTKPLVTPADLPPSKSLLFVDLSVPSAVDAAVGAVEDVTLVDLEAVQRCVNSGRAERVGEVDSGMAIVAEEVQRYLGSTTERTVAPLITGLRAKAESIRASEVSSANRLRDLDADQRAAVDELTKSIVAKLMHDPTVNLKAVAGTPEGERLAEALRRLFEV